MAETVRQSCAASALSDHIDTRTACTEVIASLDEQLSARGATADLVLVFASFHHAAAMRATGAAVQQSLRPGALLGATAESVLGVDREREGRAGLSALALSMPGASIRAFGVNPDDSLPTMRGAQEARDISGADDSTRAIMLLADPFSTPLPQVLNLFETCRGDGPHIPIAGGLASGASQPGGNVLLLNDQAQSSGLVGATIGGDVEVDFIVSQGCRPIGEPLRVTKAERNVIFEFGGRRAVDVVQEMAQELDEGERELLSRGLFVGIVINEYKERFGRGDFLIRNVMGVDQQHGAMAIGEVIRAGQTVQMHVRDAQTASEDLQLLLDLQSVRGRPFAAAVFTCNGRGSRLFEQPNHDVSALRERLGDVSIAGLFAAGEIGPIGDRSFLHGHTLSAMLFRDPHAGE